MHVCDYVHVLGHLCNLEGNANVAVNMVSFCTVYFHTVAGNFIILDVGRSLEI